MTTIRIMKQVKELLKNSDDKGALDDKLNVLLNKSVKPSHTFESKREDSTNMEIKPETLDRLKEFKLYNTESHSDTIMRLLNELDD